MNKQFIECMLCGFREEINKGMFKYYKPENYDELTTYVIGCEHCNEKDK